MHWNVLTAILAFLPLTFAQNASFATFVLNGTGASSNNALIWSINTVKSSGDVYFHLSAPASGSWVAIGFGNQMAGSLMMIAYPSANNSGITISPRIASGHSEPVYTSDIKVEKRFDANLTTPNFIDQTKNIMYIDGVCRGCATWKGGKLDLGSTSQPFIFATGPGQDMNSDDPAAPLKRHSYYGNFNMNMQKATSESNGTVPQPVQGKYTLKDASSVTSSRGDNNVAPGAHAALMIFSFLVLFPFGSIILRVFDKIMLHAIVQGFGTLLILVSFGLAIYISGQYNRSKDFRSAHQIIGLILVMGVLAQLGLGIVGHRIFKKSGKPAKFAKVHLFLGPILMILAAVNGGLGWKLALTDWMVVRYSIIVVAIFIVFAPLRLLGHKCQRRRERKKAAAGGQGPAYDPEGYQRPEFVPKQPYYSAVPLNTYHSTDSVPQYYAPPQTRPMV